MDDDYDFDAGQLLELHAKAEREGLTEEEARELVSMLRQFNDEVGPALQSLANIFGDALVEIGDALQPLAELNTQSADESATGRRALPERFEDARQRRAEQRERERAAADARFPSGDEDGT